MKERSQQDEIIKDKIATALKRAMKKRSKTHEETADLLQVELGTLYKYLAGDMIPGGNVLWRACQHLGMVLDADGIRVTRRQVGNVGKAAHESAQYAFPFISESVEGNRVLLTVRRKDPEYVQVRLRIKVAG
jgi:transcriptional regulator with XRE-family HTH domain